MLPKKKKKKNSLRTVTGTDFVAVRDISVIKAVWGCNACTDWSKK